MPTVGPYCVDMSKWSKTRAAADSLPVNLGTLIWYMLNIKSYSLRYTWAFGSKDAFCGVAGGEMGLSSGSGVFGLSFLLCGIALKESEVCPPRDLDLLAG